MGEALGVGLDKMGVAVALNGELYATDIAQRLANIHYCRLYIHVGKREVEIAFASLTKVYYVIKDIQEHTLVLIDKREQLLVVVVHVRLVQHVNRHLYGIQRRAQQIPHVSDKVRLALFVLARHGEQHLCLTL